MLAQNEGFVVSFGPFQADLRSGELLRGGAKVHLQDQPFQVLAALLRRSGQLVTREELRHELWPADTFLEFDQALNTAIKKIRLALSDDALSPCYVQTIPKRGYRWIAPVTFADTIPAPCPPAPELWRIKFRAFGMGTLLGLLLSMGAHPASRQRVGQSLTSAVLVVQSRSADLSAPCLRNQPNCQPWCWPIQAVTRMNLQPNPVDEAESSAGPPRTAVQ
jgi:DNA-binding winged helix-turn-helix (wHTH) protein